MKFLDDVPTFPREARETLESEYGIETAEAFYDHWANDPEGLGVALKLSASKVDRLAKIVEGHLSPARIARSKEKHATNPRGVIVDPTRRRQA